MEEFLFLKLFWILFFVLKPCHGEATQNETNRQAFSRQSALIGGDSGTILVRGYLLQRKSPAFARPFKGKRRKG